MKKIGIWIPYVNFHQRYARDRLIFFFFINQVYWNVHNKFSEHWNFHNKYSEHWNFHNKFSLHWNVDNILSWKKLVFEFHVWIFIRDACDGCIACTAPSKSDLKNSVVCVCVCVWKRKCVSVCDCGLLVGVSVGVCVWVWVSGRKWGWVGVSVGEWV